MIDDEGKYRDVNWWKYNEGSHPFYANADGKIIKASSLHELQMIIDESISGSHDAVLKTVSNEKNQLLSTKIPSYLEILKRYKPQLAEILKKKKKPKLLTPENRIAVLKMTTDGTAIYAVEGKLVNFKKNIGDNRTYEMSARVRELPNSKLREDIDFQINEDSHYLGHFTLSRIGTLKENEWNLFHRQVYKDEYKGGSKHDCGVSRVAMDAVNIFLQDRADRLGEKATCTIVSSQPHVIIWALKEGFQLENPEQEKRWQQIQNGTGLEMRDEDHVFLITTSQDYGWDPSEHGEYAFQVKLKKIFFPQKKKQS